MILSFVHFLILGMAAIPLIYYALALFSAWQFFRASHKARPLAGYTPPVSNLKPIRGLDPDAYENFASFCRQDYPEYEIVFCVGDASEPALPTIQRLIRDFPDCQIRVLIGSGRVATNDKVAKRAGGSQGRSSNVLLRARSQRRKNPRPACSIRRNAL
jgi:ceramide glucosyltransferase